MDAVITQSAICIYLNAEMSAGYLFIYYLLLYGTNYYNNTVIMFIFVGVSSFDTCTCKRWSLPAVY